MKNLYLIIIAFVLGILIYTILPKFCGCDKVLEGHEPHLGDGNYEKIYHLLNTLPWYDDEGDYDSMPESFSNWTNNTCGTVLTYDNTGYQSMYQHIDTDCSETRVDCESVNQSSEYPRLLICQLEEYANRGSEVLKDEFRFDLGSIDPNRDNILATREGTYHDPWTAPTIVNVVKFAKVAHRLIKKHEYLHGLQWYTSGFGGEPCTKGDSGCAWVDGLRHVDGRGRHDASDWNNLKLGILNYRLDPGPPVDNLGVKVYSGYRGTNEISKVSFMHTLTALGISR